MDMLKCILKQNDGKELVSFQQE